MENNNNPSLSNDQNKDTNNAGLSPKFDSLDNPQSFKNHINNLKAEIGKNYSELEVKATEYLKPPASAWVQIIDSKNLVLGTLGNFSLFIGKAKSRKSFFVSIAISSLLYIDGLFNQFKG